MKQSIVLGNKQLGEVLIQAIEYSWQEFPTLAKDKLRTDKSIYLELDGQNFNKLSEFYREVVSGDLVEGLDSKVSTYYKILFVRENGKELSQQYFKSLYPEFDSWHTNEMSDTLTYIVEVH